MLASIIDDWGISEYLIVGRSDEKNQVDQQTKVKADLFESIIGAIAVDSKWDHNGVHPGVKVPVGNRMYNTIMNMVYGANYEYSGPLYESMTVSGNKVILTFTHADGLQIRSGDTALKGFTVSADGKTFVEATATIVGNTVEVSAASVANPVAVRYAYVNKVYETRVPSPAVYVPKGDGTYGQAIAQDTLGGNLENSASLPAAPFEATLAD